MIAYLAAPPRLPDFYWRFMMHEPVQRGLGKRGATST
jgi:hypothetical protein